MTGTAQYSASHQQRGKARSSSFPPACVIQASLAIPISKPIYPGRRSVEELGFLSLGKISNDFFHAIKQDSIRPGDQSSYQDVIVGPGNRHRNSSKDGDAGRCLASPVRLFPRRPDPATPGLPLTTNPYLSLPSWSITGSIANEILKSKFKSHFYRSQMPRITGVICQFACACQASSWNQFEYPSA